MQMSLPAVSKQCPAAPRGVISEGMKTIKGIAVALFDIVKKVTAFALTILLAIFFPGSFILGTGIGLAVGIFAASETVKKSLETISKIWERQSWFAVSALLFMAFWGLPYTTYIASALRGSYLGVTEALSAKA